MVPWAHMTTSGVFFVSATSIANVLRTNCMRPNSQLLFVCGHCYVKKVQVNAVSVVSVISTKNKDSKSKPECAVNIDDYTALYQQYEASKLVSELGLIFEQITSTHEAQIKELKSKLREHELAWVEQNKYTTQSIKKGSAIHAH